MVEGAEEMAAKLAGFRYEIIDIAERVHDAVNGALHARKTLCCSVFDPIDLSLDLVSKLLELRFDLLVQTNSFPIVNVL